jgi:hypothetical protein
VVVESDACKSSYWDLAAGRITGFPVRDFRERLSGLGCRLSSDRGLLEKAAERQKSGHADPEQSQ